MVTQFFSKTPHDTCPEPFDFAQDRPVEECVGSNGCGWAASIGIRKTVMGEIKGKVTKRRKTKRAP